MKLRFTSRATANLLEIADYLHARNPAAAKRVRAAIYESLQNLILFPQLGRRQKTDGVRKLVTRKYAYLVYYTINEADDEIIILRVRHPARRRQHEDLLLPTRLDSRRKRTT
jgi:plasmid stabilization system protein ParE